MEEAKQVHKMFKAAKKSKYFTTESNMVHIVSAKWFVKWAKYSGFDMLSDKRLRKGSMNDLEEERSHPGPITSTDLLVTDAVNILTDPDPVR